MVLAGPGLSPGYETPTAHETAKTGGDDADTEIAEASQAITRLLGGVSYNGRTA